MNKIKVLIIDDSILYRQMLYQSLQKYEEIDVIGMARDSYKARDKIIECNPDVLLLDIEMPGVDGIDFLKILNKQRPIPTIVMSSNNKRCDEAIKYGAAGFIEKVNSKDNEEFIFSIVLKIKEVLNISSNKLHKYDNKIEEKKYIKASSKKDSRVIAIGASMGGVEAVRNVIMKLPNNLPAILITQHMPAGFTNTYASRLDSECSMKVKEAIDGEEVFPGYAYIAPGNYHMGIIKKYSRYIIKLEKSPKIKGYCPSVDYLFKSVANEVGKNAIGIIMTGMGSDGAEGLLEIKKSGGYTIGQNKESCAIYGMPMVAKKIGAVIKEVDLEIIPSLIVNELKKI